MAYFLKSNKISTFARSASYNRLASFSLVHKGAWESLKEFTFIPEFKEEIIEILGVFNIEDIKVNRRKEKDLLITITVSWPTFKGRICGALSSMSFLP